MHGKRVATSAALMCATVMVVLPSAASAGDTECVGALSGVHDNVIVPPGASCTLAGATVAGTVKAQQDARLFASDNLVEGNIVGDKAEVMDLRRNTVGGSIDVKEGETDDPGVDDVQIFGNQLPGNGDIKVEKMTGEIEVGVLRDPSLGNVVAVGNIFVQENRPVPQEGFFGLEVSSNTVGGNLQVFKTMGPAPKAVNNNRVAENLQCKENDEPFASAGNTAGQAEDQCRT
jgi:hypothetical protein